jgi:hypothetical protein
MRPHLPLHNVGYVDDLRPTGIERPIGRQEVEVAMPIQLRAMGLNERDQGDSTIGACPAISQRERERPMRRPNQVREELSVMEKVRPQPLGDGKRPEAVEHLGEHVIEKVFRPEKDSLGMARGAEESSLARERHDAPTPATLTGIDCHSLPGIAAEHEPFDGRIDNRAEGAEGPLKANGVNPEEGLVMIGHDPERWGLQKPPGPGLDNRQNASGFPHAQEASTNRAGECKPLERHEINKLMVRWRAPSI